MALQVHLLTMHFKARASLSQLAKVILRAGDKPPRYKERSISTRHSRARGNPSFPASRGLHGRGTSPRATFQTIPVRLVCLQRAA